jgi:hypothetical protein
VGDGRNGDGQALLVRRAEQDQIVDIVRVTKEIEAAEARTREDAEADEMRQFLADAEQTVDKALPREPFIDDNGTARDPSGNPIDPDDESWWAEDWSATAAELLGPRWVAGHNPGDTDCRRRCGAAELSAVIARLR